MHDTIGDMLTRIRNAGMAQHRYVDVLYSKVNRQIANVLKDRGMVANYLVDDAHRKIRIFLKYDKQRRSLIHGLKRVSKPGCRLYAGQKQIPYVMDGLGFAIMSTSQGIFDGETARSKGCGGEILCTVW